MKRERERINESISFNFIVNDFSLKEYELFNTNPNGIEVINYRNLEDDNSNSYQPIQMKKFPTTIYQILLTLFVIVLCSATVMFGFGNGCLLATLLLSFSKLPVVEYSPFCILITFTITAGSFGFGIKSHSNELDSEQMFLNYDFLKIIIPVLLLGLKIGLFLSLLLSNRILSSLIIIVIIYSTSIAIKR